jgi:hypothetical protein
MSKYLSSSAADSGRISSVVFHQDFVNQGAAVPPPTVLYHIPSFADFPWVGLYRINWTAYIIAPDSQSSVLGGKNGFQISFTAVNGVILKTSNPAGTTTSSANTAGTTISDLCLCNAQPGTDVTFSFDYTSKNGEMRYNLSVYVEFLPFINQN